MRRKLLWSVLLLALFATPAFVAERETKADLVGVYRCDGVNPDGTAYEGTVEIAALDGTFLVRWTLSDGATVVGVGVYSGGVLAVSYYGGSPAVVVYKAEHDRLVGEWTMGADGGVYPETLTKTAKEAPKPVRRVPTAGGQIL